MPKKHEAEKLTLRSYSVEVRADDTSEGVIEGVPIVFNQKTRIVDWAGEYDEIIDRGALDGADLKDVLLFVNHDMNKIALARSKNGNENSTMSFDIKDDGLHMKATLDIENNTEARSLYSAIKRGDISGMSFAFRIKEDNWTDIDKKIPCRTVRKISVVHEVSVVNFPAYPQTSVNARSSEEAEYSPLVEAREKYAEETARSNQSQLEIEKLKYRYLLEV